MFCTDAANKTGFAFPFLHFRHAFYFWAGSLQKYTHQEVDQSGDAWRSSYIFMKCEITHPAAQLWVGEHGAENQPCLHGEKPHSSMDLMAELQ